MTKHDTTLRTTAQVAALLGVKSVTITYWAKRLKLGTRLVPGSRTPLLFSPADIAKLERRPKVADHLRSANPSPAALYRREYRARQKLLKGFGGRAVVATTRATTDACPSPPTP